MNRATLRNAALRLLLLVIIGLAWLATRIATALGAKSTGCRQGQTAPSCAAAQSRALPKP